MSLGQIRRDQLKDSYSGAGKVKKSALTRSIIQALRFVCVIGLVLLAFAHRPVGFEWNEYQSTQYMLPDGSYPVLCLSDHQASENHDKGHIHQTGCEACRISAAFLCPEPDSSSGFPLQSALASAVTPAQPVLRRNIYPPSAPPHAPPFA